MSDDLSAKALAADPMRLYRARRDTTHRSVASRYQVLGFISSGTYGRVYKARALEDERLHAIKKFKPDKEGDATTYTGISQSAVREIALNREISHENVVALKEVILEDKSIYMVFEYAEHDFLVRVMATTVHLRRFLTHGSNSFIIILKPSAAQ
jgi:cyclin-dependent kinase 8/11